MAVSQQRMSILNGRALNNKDTENKGKKLSQVSKSFRSPSLFIIRILIVVSHLPKPTKNPPSKATRRYQSTRNHKTTNSRKESIHTTIWAAYIPKGCTPTLNPKSPNLPKNGRRRRRKDMDDNPSIHAIFVLLLFLRLRRNQRDLV